MHDFIAIGDTVTDAFIKLPAATIEGEPNTPDYKICLPFADKVPYESVTIIPAVGNAANAAVSAARLGLKTAFVTNLGDDEEGKRCLASLQNNGVSTEFVKVHSGMKTNYHYVLWYGDDRTILTKHEVYPYELLSLETTWIYFSSVSAEAYPFHDKLAGYLEEHPEIKFAFEPGKNEIRMGVEKLARLYRRSDIFFCNVDEAEKILGIYTLGTSELLKRMQAFGPKTVVITDGSKGAYAYDGTTMYQQLPYPDPKPPLDRTGAGDAFGSTTVAALQFGKDLPTALQWGAVNSMSVVQEIGAQKGLLNREKIEEYLKQAPSEFQTKKL